MYQWQSSPDNVTWTPITNATNNYYTAAVSGPVYYDVVVTCSHTLLSATTASQSLNLLTVPLR